MVESVEPRAEGPAVVREGELGAPAVLVLDPAGEGRHGRIPASWEDLGAPVSVTWLRLPASEAPDESARAAFEELTAAGQGVHLVASNGACRLAEELAMRRLEAVLSVVLVDPEVAAPDDAGLDGGRLDGAGLDGAGLDGAGLDGGGLVGGGLDDGRLDRIGQLAAHGLTVRVMTAADADRAEQDGPLPLGHPAVVQVLYQVVTGHR
jgi:hypothetical protein